ncbi:hypothetical protein E4U30_000662 [Claviceps sp. LM220 group G6]|nr:hypothetical protein E4U30_000662 [Claviceps sp. LM220 group G6]
MFGNSHTVHSGQGLSTALDYSFFDALWRGRASVDGGGEAKSFKNPFPATSNIVEQSPLGTRSSFDAAKGIALVSRSLEI